MAVVVVALAYLAFAAPLRAQDDDQPRRWASFTTGASVGDGGTALALSTGLGFWFSQRLGVDVEVAYARKLDFTLDLCPAPLVCVLGGQLPVTGRTVALVPQLAVRLRPRVRRVNVYAQAGIGAGHVRQRYFFGPPRLPNVVNRAERTRSSLTVALAFGGGAMVHVSRSIGIGVDVRSLHLLDEAARPDVFIEPSGTLSTLRVGSRVVWLF